MGRKFDGREGIKMPVKLLVIGEAKSGKTTFLSTFPDPYVLAMSTEDGSSAFEGTTAYGYECDNWAEIEERTDAITGICAAGEQDFKSVIVTGLSFIGPALYEHVLAVRNGNKDEKYHIHTLDKQGWGIFQVKLKAFITAFQTLPNVHVGWEIHSRTFVKDSVDGTSKVMRTLDFPGTQGNIFINAIKNVCLVKMVDVPNIDQEGRARGKHKVVRAYLGKTDGWDLGCRAVKVHEGRSIPEYIENPTFDALVGVLESAGVAVARF